MNPSQIVEETKRKLEAVTGRLREEFKKLRTGRAHPGMLDGIAAEAYGQTMPLKAVASIAAPEAQLLVITPFDPNNLQAIAEAIRSNQGLGLAPTDDGRVIRIVIPPLTTETRKSMATVLHQKVEESMISARQIRHEAMQRGEQAEKTKEIGKDERIRFEKHIDEQVSKHKAEVEALASAKEQEIMTV